MLATIAPTITPASTQESFALTITRRCYATCLMTGKVTGYYVRNWKIVG